MTLLQGKIGGHYQVERLELEGTRKRRLQALGLTAGTNISVLNNKKSGSVIFMVRGTRLAVGREIAEAIKVLEVFA
jgi:ferrous iron transport protein A